MKKRIALTGILISFTLICCFIIGKQNRTVQFSINEKQIYIELTIDDITENIFPWYHEGKQIYYFFLPAFVKETRIYFDGISDNNISINGVSRCWGQKNQQKSFALPDK